MFQKERKCQSVFNGARDTLPRLWRDRMRCVAKENDSAGAAAPAGQTLDGVSGKYQYASFDGEFFRISLLGFTSERDDGQEDRPFGSVV